jgi:hypothetical protein
VTGTCYHTDTFFLTPTDCKSGKSHTIFGVVNVLQNERKIVYDCSDTWNAALCLFSAEQKAKANFIMGKAKICGIRLESVSSSQEICLTSVQNMRRGGNTRCTEKSDLQRMPHSITSSEFYNFREICMQCNAFKGINQLITSCTSGMRIQVSEKTGTCVLSRQTSLHKTLHLGYLVYSERQSPFYEHDRRLDSKHFLNFFTEPEDACLYVTSHHFMTSRAT